MRSINPTLAVFLVPNSDARAIKIEYEPGAPDTANRVFKTFDQDIAKDDMVVIPTNTRHGMTVVKVIETDVDVNFDSTTEMHWIIDRVDVEAHQELLKSDERLMKAVHASDKRKRMEELRATMTEGMNEDEKAKLIEAFAHKEGDAKATAD